MLGCLGVIKIGVRLSAGTALHLEKRGSDVSGQVTVILTGTGVEVPGLERGRGSESVAGATVLGYGGSIWGGARGLRATSHTGRARMGP